MPSFKLGEWHGPCICNLDANHAPGMAFAYATSVPSPTTTGGMARFLHTTTGCSWHGPCIGACMRRAKVGLAQLLLAQQGSCQRHNAGSTQQMCAVQVVENKGRGHIAFWQAGGVPYGMESRPVDHNI